MSAADLENEEATTSDWWAAIDAVLAEANSVVITDASPSSIVLNSNVINAMSEADKKSTIQRLTGRPVKGRFIVWNVKQLSFVFTIRKPRRKKANAVLSDIVRVTVANVIDTALDESKKHDVDDPFEVAIPTYKYPGLNRLQSLANGGFKQLLEESAEKVGLSVSWRGDAICHFTKKLNRA